MPDIIITPSTGKLEFIDNSAQVTRRHSFTLDHSDGLVLDAPLSAAAISAPLNVINVTVNNSNANYPFVLAQSGETGAKNLLMDGAGGTYNPSTNTATIDISGNSATTTLASDSTNLGGVVAASYVTLTGTQTLTNKTITGTFTGNLTGTGSWATNAVSAVSATTATNSTQLNGQAASYYTNIPARLGYTPVNQAGDTIAGNLTVNGNFTVNGSVTAFSASNIYLSSSVITVEDNILTLNAFSPYLRYAGIEMYDSGSGTLSQLLWDGDGDYFFLTGSSVNGKIITGPDGQTNLSSNYVPKATAGYKLGNSLIYDNGTNIGIGITTPVYKTEIYSGVKTSAFTGLSISNFNNYDGTDNSLVKSQLRFAILENPISTYDASQRTFAILESGNEANNSSSDGFFAISTRLNGAVAEKFRITSTGNVGIGTTNPVSILDVVGLNASFPATSSTTQSTGSLVRLRNGNSNLVLDIGGNGGNGNWLQSTNRSDLSANYPLLLNPNGGNVGIGMTGPAYKLDVGAAGSDVISVRLTPGYERVRFNTFDLLGYNDGNLWMIGNNPTNTLVLGKTWDWDNQIGIAYTPGTVGNSGGILQIGQISKNNANYTHGITRLYTNGLERITIIANGNVGIGTTLPTTPLHVVGVISGSSFSGAGTGLTGTAASLTAGTATIANGVATGAVKSGGLEENSVITSKIADGNVTNVKLASSSVTIGSSAVSLGSTLTTIAGLTSVTSTTFVGALTGNASTATNSTQLGGVAAASYVTLTGTQTLTGKTITGTFTGNLTGTASWASNAVTALNGGVTSVSAGTGIGTSASTGAVTITNSSPNATHTGDVTGATALTIANDAVTTVKILNANVTNAKLANSSVTIGSTAVSLGGTVTTFAGLASVTSTAFVGALTGNASTATNSTQLGGVAAASYVTLNDTQSLTNKTITGTFTGNLTGTSSWASNALTSLACTGNAATVTNGAYLNTAQTFTAIATFAVPSRTISYTTPSIQVYTGDNTPPGIAFHRGGVSATYLYESGGELYTNPWTAVGQTGKLLAAGNYTDYTVTKTGTGASGTWAITSSWATNAVTALNVGNGTITIAAGTGVGVGSSNTFTTNQSGATTVTITNNGVTAITTNTGLSTNASATGAVTITNTGVTAITTNTGLSTNASATGAVTITNTGVTSNVAGTGISLSGATGAVTITNSSPNATHTGDVTGATALTIASNAVTSVKIADSNVTLAKIVNISTGTILGNNGAGAAAPLALTSAQVASMLSGQTMNIGGNSATATILQTARNIGGVSFNGSADINLPGVNTAGNQNTSGTATTATTANALNTGNSYTVNALTATSEIGTRGTNIGVNLERGDATIATLRFDADNFRIWGGGTGGIGEILRVTETGNVGIGTTVPGQKLDVEGRIRTRGATGTGGFEIGAATTGTAKWRIEWDSASDSLDFNWVG